MKKNTVNTLVDALLFGHLPIANVLGFFSLYN